MTRAPMPHSSRGRVAAVLGLTFVAGTFAGVAGTRAFDARDTREPEPAAARVGAQREDSGGAPVEGAGIPRQIVQLGLSADERERIRAVVARRQPTADSIMESVTPRVRKLELTMRQEMMCVLTPAQRSQWMDWRRRQGLSLSEGEDWLALVSANTCPVANGGK